MPALKREVEMPARFGQKPSHIVGLGAGLVLLAGALDIAFWQASLNRSRAEQHIIHIQAPVIEISTATQDCPQID